MYFFSNLQIIPEHFLLLTLKNQGHSESFSPLMHVFSSLPPPPLDFFLFVKKNCLDIEKVSVDKKK